MTTPATTSTDLPVDEQQLRSLDQTSLWVRRVRPMVWSAGEEPLSEPRREGPSGDDRSSRPARLGASLGSSCGPPSGAARARLAFVHGFGEHGGRYVPTLRWFAARGFDAQVVDLRGHGRSGGRRTFVWRWSDYLDDVEAYLQHVEAQLAGPRAPLFVVGHSMGGLVVARTLQERQGRLPPLAGAVLMSPFLRVKMQLPAWKTFAGNVLSRWLPWFRIPTDVDVASLSRDEAVGRAYLADPLVEKGATTRWYTEAMAAQDEAFARAAALTLPVLVQHGEDDGLADVEGAKRLLPLLGSADKELRLWPGARHELFNETHKEEVWTHLLQWLERRLG